MTVEPPPDFREELDIVRIDPLFLERQRNRYASRGVAFLVILNGIAALVLLANFARLSPQIENAPTLAAAMVVFGAGVAAALASMFFAYLRRTLRIEAPERAPLRPLGWWLAVLAAVAKYGMLFSGAEDGRQSRSAGACERGDFAKIPVDGRAWSAGSAWPSRASGTEGRERRPGRERCKRRPGRKRREGRSGPVGPPGPPGPANATQPAAPQEQTRPQEPPPGP